MRLTACLIVISHFIANSAVSAALAQDSSSSLCPALPIHVASVSAKDRLLICRAAEKAQAFYQSHGIHIHRQIRIRLHKDEIKNHANHIGLYRANKDHIDMVTLDHARHHCSEKPPFDIQMDEALYVSFVIHEVAHAIADQNFSNASSSLVVQEYLAYVTQFSTMERHFQDKILQQYKVSPFKGVEEMSLTYYQLDPNAFGVKAYLHYKNLQDKSAFIRGLLSGSIKPDAKQVEWW